MSSQYTRCWRLNIICAKMHSTSNRMCRAREEGKHLISAFVLNLISNGTVRFRFISCKWNRFDSFVFSCRPKRQSELCICDSKFIECFRSVGVGHKCTYNSDEWWMYDRVRCDSHQFNFNRLPIRCNASDHVLKTANFIVFNILVKLWSVQPAKPIRSETETFFFSLSWLKWKNRQYVITGVYKHVEINKNPLKIPRPLHWNTLVWILSHAIDRWLLSHRRLHSNQQIQSKKMLLLLHFKRTTFGYDFFNTKFYTLKWVSFIRCARKWGSEVHCTADSFELVQ